MRKAAAALLSTIVLTFVIAGVAQSDPVDSGEGRGAGWSVVVPNVTNPVTGADIKLAQTQASSAYSAPPPPGNNPPHRTRRVRVPRLRLVRCLHDCGRDRHRSLTPAQPRRR